MKRKPLAAAVVAILNQRSIHPVKIDFSAVLKTLDGSPIKAKDEKGERDLTLAAASVEALLAPAQNESGEQKFKAYQVAQKVHAGGEVEIEPEDVVLIRSKIGFIYGPAVVGPAFTLLG